LLDIEMPDGRWFTQATITAALAAGNISTADVLDRCHRILKGWFSLDPSKRHPCGGGICINNNVSTPEHKALAQELAAKSTVLVKNENSLLPLARGLKLALIGPDAVKPYTGGQGSGSVVTNAVVSPMAALVSAGANVTYDPGTTPASAAAAAAAADVAIVFGHASSGEGSDRATLTLSGNLDDVIPAVTTAQPKTVVVSFYANHPAHQKPTPQKHKPEPQPYHPLNPNQTVLGGARRHPHGLARRRGGAARELSPGRANGTRAGGHAVWRRAAPGQAARDAPHW
jgi:hypothetical protein